MSEEARRHILNLQVENREGVLARIAALIAAKGYNIESLTVAAAMDETVSNMTIVVYGDDWVIEQATKQLNRLVDVIRVRDLTDLDIVQRELILLRVNGKSEERAELLRMADIFRAKVVDVTATTFTFSLTGDRTKNDAFIELCRPFGVIELHRSGKVAMLRDKKTTTNS